LSPPAMNNNKLKVVLHTHIPTNSDQVMGGVSMARLTREMFDGRLANVLRGSVKMDNNGGFIQMATNLQRDGTSVDVSAFDGVELFVQSGSAQMESFNVQYVVVVVVVCSTLLAETKVYSCRFCFCLFVCFALYLCFFLLSFDSVKTTDCLRPFSSYRQTFEVRPSVWEQIRLPFAEFRGCGPGAEHIPFNLSALKRFAVVAIGRPMEVELAIAEVRLYKDHDETTTTTFQP
jgi:Complex I intermediate-associated protein 30 (CIA30)